MPTVRRWGYSSMAPASSTSFALLPLSRSPLRHPPRGRDPKSPSPSAPPRSSGPGLQSRSRRPSRGCRAAPFADVLGVAKRRDHEHRDEGVGSSRRAEWHRRAEGNHGGLSASRRPGLSHPRPCGKPDGSWLRVSAGRAVRRPGRRRSTRPPFPRRRRALATVVSFSTSP